MLSLYVKKGVGILMIDSFIIFMHFYKLGLLVAIHINILAIGSGARRSFYWEGEEGKVNSLANCEN